MSKQDELQKFYGNLAFNLSSRAGSDYNQAFGTPMPSNTSVWLQSWFKGEMPGILREHDKERARLENTPKALTLSTIRDLILVIAGAWAGVEFNNVALQNTATAALIFVTALVLLVIVATLIGRAAAES